MNPRQRVVCTIERRTPGPGPNHPRHAARPPSLVTAQRSRSCIAVNPSDRRQCGQRLGRRIRRCHRRASQDTWGSLWVYAYTDEHKGASGRCPLAQVAGAVPASSRRTRRATLSLPPLWPPETERDALRTAVHAGRRRHASGSGMFLPAWLPGHARRPAARAGPLRRPTRHDRGGNAAPPRASVPTTGPRRRPNSATTGEPSRH